MYIYKSRIESHTIKLIIISRKSSVDVFFTVYLYVIKQRVVSPPQRIFEKKE